MSLKGNKTIGLIVLVLPLILVVNSCSIIYPPEIRYNDYFVPVVKSEDVSYTLDEETGAIVFDVGGSSVEVKAMTEKDLNALFPDESVQGEYSTNPYTYGNWMDPNLGYIPCRFTVFQVTIINRNFAKMMIDPVEAVLVNDLGEVHHSYTFSQASALYGKSFENYYRSVRGQSGNEYYRYEMRQGMVRGKNYGLDEIIFRGDTYSGLVTFDVQKPEAKRVQLVLKDVVYRFDAFNRPSDMTTAKFNFERKVEKIIVTPEMKQKELEREKVRIRIVGAQQIVNNRINDNARSSLEIDHVMTNNSPQMEKCFIDLYRRDEVDPGRMTVSFTIGTDGSIVSQNVIETVGINSTKFMNCLLGVINTMKFEKIEDMPLTGTNIVKGPAQSVNILYPLEFTIYIEE